MFVQDIRALHTLSIYVYYELLVALSHLGTCTRHTSRQVVGLVGF